MSTKKKRNKKYKGSIADARPTILKVSAVKRHPLHQWWVDHQQSIKPFLPIIGIVLVVLLVIVGIISIIWPQ